MKDRCPGHITEGTCPLLSRSEPGETGKFFSVIASPSLPVILSEAKNLIPLRTGSAKQSLPLPYGIASSLTLLAMTETFRAWAQAQ